MGLDERLEQILQELRPVFRREASFNWFVLLVWGVLLSSQAPGVTSYVNALGLSEGYYHQALHWFESRAFGTDELCRFWGQWLSAHPDQHRLQGERVYVGDGIKVAKEGRKMPGVKRLHQESEDVSKPEWIRGHYFSALCQLLGAGEALFATPIILKLHDGIEGIDLKAEETLVEKMAAICVQLVAKGSYVILDAYYASEKVLKPFRTAGIHLITRVRSTTVATAAFCSLPGKHGPGCHRKWGSDVKLKTLFAPIEECSNTLVWLYGRQVTVYYQSFCLYWDSPDALVLFVLTQLPTGKPIILLSSDITLSPEQVIEAYGWRFKIEVTFRTLIQVLGGFCYRFWLKAMTKAPKWPKNLRLAQQPEGFHAQVLRKVEAFERFINLNAIALGLLQVLALEMPKSIWAHFPRWFRTLPKHGYPSEQIVRLSIQHQLPANLIQSRPALLLTKLLTNKIDSSQGAQHQDLDA
jgi:Transposase DDE domain